MGFNGDSKLGDLLANPAANEVLTRHLPEIKNAGPMLNMAKGMTLNAISRFPQAKMTPERLQALVADLEKI
jgi:hypothetical protein